MLFRFGPNIILGSCSAMTIFKPFQNLMIEIDFQEVIANRFSQKMPELAQCELHPQSCSQSHLSVDSGTSASWGNSLGLTYYVLSRAADSMGRNYRSLMKPSKVFEPWDKYMDENTQEEFLKLIETRTVLGHPQVAEQVDLGEWGDALKDNSGRTQVMGNRERCSDNLSLDRNFCPSLLHGNSRTLGLCRSMADFNHRFFCVRRCHLRNC